MKILSLPLTTAMCLTMVLQQELPDGSSNCKHLQNTCNAFHYQVINCLKQFTVFLVILKGDERGRAPGDTLFNTHTHPQKKKKKKNTINILKNNNNTLYCQILT